MSGHDASTAAGELIEAFNVADWERLRAAVTGDLVYEETGTGRRVDGADGYVALCRGWREAFPDLRGVIGRSAVHGDWAALELVWMGTQSGALEGPMGTIPASGRYGETRATLWARSADGHVAEIHHHLDVMGLLRNIGALPA